MRNFRLSKGQELVEFALILPVMLVILVAIAEMGFMWTLRGTVSDAVKSSVQQMQLIAGMTEGDASNLLRDNIKSYLENHGVPNAGSVAVTLNTIGENTTVNVSYQYNPTFTLPNFFGIQLLPDTMTMGSSQVINSAIFGPNNYAGGDIQLPLNVNMLDPTTATSILKSDPTGERQHMAFLVDLPGPYDKIVNWWGHDVMTANSAINAQTGTIWVKGPEYGGWGDTNDSYADILLSQGYTTVVYSDGGAGLNISAVQMPGPANIHDGELGALSWCTPASAGASTCDGDLTTTASGTLLVNSFLDVGAGYEVLPPAPLASDVDQVSLPSGDLVADKTFRNVTYQNEDMAKLKFYIPKSKSGSFVPPADVPIPDPDAVLQKVTDIDGDGIPNAYDTYPTEADADKDNVLDGFQTAYNGGLKTEYNVYGWGSIDGKTGSIPTYSGNTINTVSSASALTPGTYVNPSESSFADNNCAANGVITAANCGQTRPYFLRVKKKYTTNLGQDIRVASNASALYATEKYKAPDPNRKVFQVEVIARDFDKDGTFEPATGAVISVDDDGNDDGKNDASTADTWPLGDTSGNYTRGLMFVDNTTGRINFGIPAGSNMGYPSVDPSTDLGYSPGDKL